MRTAAEYRAEERRATRLAAIEHRQQGLDAAVRALARRLGPDAVAEVEQILNAERARRPST